MKILGRAKKSLVSIIRLCSHTIRSKKKPIMALLLIFSVFFSSFANTSVFATSSNNVDTTILEIKETDISETKTDAESLDIKENETLNETNNEETNMNNENNNSDVDETENKEEDQNNNLNNNSSDSGDSEDEETSPPSSEESDETINEELTNNNTQDQNDKTESDDDNANTDKNNSNENIPDEDVDDSSETSENEGENIEDETAEKENAELETDEEITLLYTDEEKGYTITITGTENILNGAVSVIATPGENERLNEYNEAFSNSESQSDYQAVAVYDISLFDENDNIVEPNGEVNVLFKSNEVQSFIETSNENEETELLVLHNLDTVSNAAENIENNTQNKEE